MRVVPYRHGVLHGVERAYAPHGKERRLARETPWEDGERQGLMTVYHLENGKPRMEVSFENGKRQGVMKTYDLPGRLVKVTPYVDDAMHGRVVEYYAETGQEKKVIPYRGGKVHGVVSEYYPDGTLKRELPAVDDRFHGVEKAYDENGQPVRTRYWLRDEPVSRAEYEAAGR